MELVLITVSVVGAITAFSLLLAKHETNIYKAQAKKAHDEGREYVLDKPVMS